MHKLYQRSHLFMIPAAFCAPLVVILLPVLLRAQSPPEGGGEEIEVWTQGGHGTNGITRNAGIWSAGVRYGWVLTEPHGPRFLNGRFEYALEASPVVMLVQRTGTAYGGSVTPAALTWNFEARGRVVPYADVSGGVLFTNTETPPGATRVNFVSSAAFGVHLLSNGRWNWTADVRFVHISNSGLSTVNPGYNTAQLRIGLDWFTQPQR